MATKTSKMTTPRQVREVKAAVAKATLRTQLDKVNADTYHGGNGGARGRVTGQARVAYAALEALKAKIAALEAQSEANPEAWFDDVGYIASTLIDAL